MSLQDKLLITANDEKLLIAALELVDLGTFKLDHGKLGLALSTTKGAASTRWSRFTTKLKKQDGSFKGDAKAVELILAVLEQVDLSTIKIDHAKLGFALNTTKGAASTRWSRFTTKLKNYKEEMSGGAKGNEAAGNRDKSNAGKRKRHETESEDEQGSEEDMEIAGNLKRVRVEDSGSGGEEVIKVKGEELLDEEGSRNSMGKYQVEMVDDDNSEDNFEDAKENFDDD